MRRRKLDFFGKLDFSKKGKLDFFGKLDFYPVYPKNPVYHREKIQFTHKIQFTTYTINSLFSSQTSTETFLFHSEKTYEIFISEVKVYCLIIKLIGKQPKVKKKL